jgi:hypothetical protein
MLAVVQRPWPLTLAPRSVRTPRRSLPPTRMSLRTMKIQSEFADPRGMGLCAVSPSFAFLSVCGTSICDDIAIAAARGNDYLLGGQIGNADCLVFQAAFKSECCAKTETSDYFDVCVICANGVAAGKEYENEQSNCCRFVSTMFLLFFICHAVDYLHRNSPVTDVNGIKYSCSSLVALGAIGLTVPNDCPGYRLAAKDAGCCAVAKTPSPAPVMMMSPMTMSPMTMAPMTMKPMRMRRHMGKGNYKSGYNDQTCPMRA